MTIKIKDPAVYECYDSAMCQTETGNPAELFEEFASQINNLDDSDGLDVDDILTVTDAIWNGNDVDLDGLKYAMCFLSSILPGETQIRYVAIANDDNGKPYIFLRPSKCFKATEDEWETAFDNTPYLERDDFAEVFGNE